MTYDFREARIMMTRSEALGTLGFPPDANPSEAELKAAKKKSALAAHPDRGGSTAQMQDINRAFDFLAPKKSQPLERNPGADDSAESDTAEQEHHAPREPIKVTFDQAVAQGHIPGNIKWLFVTEWQRSPNNFFGEESMASKSAYVAYGLKDSLAVFTLVVYNLRTYPIGSAMADQDVWYVRTFQWPVKDSAKDIHNPAWLTKHIVTSLKFPAGELAFDSKFSGKVRDAKGWKLGEYPPKSGSAMSIKQWLVDSGQVEAGAEKSKGPRKHVVELKMERNPFEQKPGFYEHPTSKGNYYKLIVIVDGREHALGEKDTEEFLKLRLAGKSALEAIYGEYYYGGEKKNLTRMPGGKGLFFVKWLAESSQSLPDDALQNLDETKLQMS